MTTQERSADRGQARGQKITPSSAHRKNERGRFGPRLSMSRTSRSGDSLGLRGLLGLLEDELDLVVRLDVDRHLAAAGESAEEQLVRERLADRVLDQPRHRPSAHLRVEA